MRNQTTNRVFSGKPGTEILRENITKIKSRPSSYIYIKRAWSGLAFLICAMLGGMVFAHAHQQRVALTSVLFNSRTGNIEVAHRLFVHDAEHAAKEIWGERPDLLDSAADQERFADYVRERFEIKDSDGRLLSLTPVGQEADGAFLWVYHETPIIDGLKEIVISNQILRDVWDDQANLVNVERGSFRGSLLFHGNVGEQALSLVGDNPN